MAGGNGTGAVPTGAADYTSTASMNPGYYVQAPGPTAPTASPAPTDPSLWGWGDMFRYLASDDPQTQRAARSRLAMLMGFAGSDSGPAQPFANLSKQNRTDWIAYTNALAKASHPSTTGGSSAPAQVRGWNPQVIDWLIQRF